MPNLYRLFYCLLWLLLVDLNHVVRAQTDSLSVSSADYKVLSSDYNRGIQVNPLGLIQGRVPGLWIIGSGSEPNRRYDAYLQGIGSFAGERQPLYVVDGVPGADPALISPADVARFRVLTDPASLALYGARSANGVIELETQRSSGTTFRAVYEGQGGVQYRTRSVDMLSADEFRARLTPNWQRFDMGGNTDWQRAISRTAFQQNHYLAASGQYANIHLGGSLTYLNAPGIIRHNALDRFSGRLTASGPVDRRFFWQLSALGRHETQLPLDATALILSQSGLPTIPIYEADGSFTPYSSFDGGNPVARLAQVTQSESIRQAQFQAYARHQLNDRLLAEGRLSHTGSAARFAYNDYAYTSQGPSDYRLLEDVSQDFLEANLRYARVQSASELRATLGAAMQQAAVRVGADVTGQPIETERTTWRLWSALAQSEWGGLNRRLWLRGAVRADGSKRFGQRQWVVSPGLTVEWRLWQRPASGASDGENQPGSAPINVLTLLVGANLAANQQSLFQTIDASQTPDLRPEMQRLLRAGIQASSLNGRWQGQFYVFNRFTTDAYWYETAAITAQTINRGQIRNNGTEWRLSGDLIRTEKIRWSVDLTGSYLFNQIASMGAANYRVINTPVSGRGLTGQNTQIVRAGVPLFTYYGYQFAGISAQGKYGLLDLNRDGRISADGDRTILGSALPRWQVGIQSRLSVGHWQLSGLVDGLSGHSLLNATQMNVANLIRFPINNVSQQAVQTGLNDYTTFTSQYVQPGNFLRLNFLSLAYRFTLLNRHALIVSSTIQNLLLRTDYGGPDPEAALGATPFGQDNQTLAPNAATASVGVRIEW